jgi:hypothetical protein
MFDIPFHILVNRSLEVRMRGESMFIPYFAFAAAMRRRRASMFSKIFL